MLIQKEDTDSKIVIKSYQPGEIKLNIGSYQHAVFLKNQEIADFSGAATFGELNFEDLQLEADQLPEILLIGSGEKHQILNNQMVQSINALGVAVEAMASRQACHTYQVLVHDRRRVYALIYP